MLFYAVNYKFPTPVILEENFETIDWAKLIDRMYYKEDPTAFEVTVKSHDEKEGVIVLSYRREDDYHYKDPETGLPFYSEATLQYFAT